MAAYFWFFFVLSVTFIVMQRFVAVPDIPQPENNNKALSSDVFHNPETFRLNYEEMEKEFKVYVYPEGKPRSILSPQYLFRSLFLNLWQRNLVYPFLVKNILESQFSTTDPSRAHLFYLPFPRDRYIKGSIAHDGRVIPLWDYVERIIAKYPYWNRTMGTDHFFVNCNEFTMYGVRDLTKNAIHLTCPMDLSSLLDFVPHKDVSLPIVRLRHAKSAIDTIRRVFSAGSAKDFRIFDHLSDEPTRLSKFKNKEFCLCPLAVDVFDSIANGCVPVILFSEYDDLPFSNILDWRKFSVIGKEAGLEHYNHILDNIDHPEYKQLRVNLLKVQHHFLWNSPPVKYDAFHMVMYQLWSRHNAIRN